MFLSIFSALLFVSLAAYAANGATTVQRTKISSCRNIPGDAGWPSSDAWNRLNATVGGRLITTIPLAHVCHDPTFSEASCDNVSQNWDYPSLMTPHPAEILAPWFQNQSCVPFTDRSTPCKPGNLASFSINVSSANDIAAGLAFAQETNIRLVIKNSGHDTGKGALSLWTHNLNSKQLIPSYNASYYRGPAVKIGAGVDGADAAEFAAQNGFRFVVGSCPTVGPAGGYTQGGGHSLLSGLYGFGADNVLEWEVVTAAGHHVVATPTQHADLYWALSGGGGGTYGVVVSMTVRVFPDGQIAIASLSFDVTTAGGVEPFWAAVGAFTTQLQPLAELGLVAEFLITNDTLDLFGMMAPGYTRSGLTALMTPMLSALAQATGTALTAAAASLAVSDSNSYVAYAALYAAVVEPLTAKNLESPVIGGRFVSRSNMANNASAVDAAIRAATDGGRFCVAVTALNARGAGRVADPIASNAVQPALRDAFLSLIIPAVWSWGQPWDEATALQEELWEVVMPPLEAATPGADAYINEANWQQPRWQDVFYGENYGRLSAIKARYDPNDVFYGLTAVGSEAWEADAEGRLCR